MSRYLLAAVLAINFAVAPLTGRAQGDGAPFTLTVVSFSAPDSAHGQQWVAFERQLKAQYGDRLSLTMLTGGQVGNEDNMMASIRRGRAHMGIISIGAAAALVPELSILSSPFLFESFAEADYVLDKVLFERFAELFSRRGLTLLRWEDGGWRSLYSRTPLIEPVDVQDYSLRTPATDSDRIYLQSLGADVVVLDFGDIVSSLQTGLVDGGVTVLNMYSITGLYEDAPHFTLTRHAFAPGVLFANRTWTETTPPEILSSILDAHGTTEERRINNRAEIDELLSELINEGVQVHDLTAAQRASWTDAAEPIRRDLIRTIGGEAERIYDLIVDGKRAFAEMQKDG